MKKILTVLLILAVAGGSAFAQTAGPLVVPTPFGFSAAPSDDVSNGMFAGPWNFIMNPALHRAAMTFDNWIARADFGIGADVSRFALMYGTNIGDLYLGAYFGGSGFGRFRNRAFAENEVQIGGNWQTLRTHTFTPLPTTAGAMSDNRVAILLGIPGMGFRLSYASNMGSVNLSDVEVTGSAGAGDHFSEFSTAYGMRQIELAWAMTGWLLDNNSIRPQATVRLNFARNFAEVTRWTSAADSTPLPSEILFSANYVEPQIVLFSDAFNFLRSDSGWTLSGDLQYELRFRIFNNDFTSGTGAARVTGDISGTRSVDGDFVERSWMQHQIRPRVRLNWAGDNVNITTRLVLMNILTSESRDTRVLTEGRLGTGGPAGATGAPSGAEDQHIFTYQFQPTLQVAMRWFAIPDRLTLQGGGSFNFGEISRTRTDRTTFQADGTAFPNNTTPFNVLTAFGDSSTGISFGLTFHFNQHFAIDAATGVTAGNNVNIFGTTAGSITQFGRIAAGITF